MPPLHVAVAALCGPTGGPATYGRRLVAALAQLTDLRLSVLTDAPAHFSACRAEVVALPMRGGVDRLRWQHLALPRALRRIAPAVFHDLKNALPRRCPCQAAVTVHDLAYYTCPETFAFASRWFLRRATRDAVRRAAAVVVPSQATADDVLRIFPVAACRVHVVHHGIDPAPAVGDDERAEVRQRLGLPERYVLHVGTIQARKNVHLVVDGVRRLRARGLPHRAVIVGRKGWLASEALREIERDDTALWLPRVADADLAAIYAAADAFVSPSAYEGFGLTVADALAAGVPTVIADLSSLPEVCGTAAVRLAELSGAAVAAALEPVLTDPGRARALAEAGRRRAADFSWDRCARQHAAIYRSLAELPGERGRP